MNNDAHSDRHQVVRLRPTEAQLRWSQFHQRRRAVTVKENVQRLWLQPASVSDVEGARSDDGNTTEESQNNSVAEGNNNNNMKVVPRRGKPVISRGRRAVLRLSKRAFRERHRDIEKYGFYMGDDAKSGDDRSGSSEEDNDDALASIFAEESFLRKRKRRHHSRRRTNASNDGGERARRFDAAFHAMMMNLAAAQPQHPEQGIVMPTKIWSRPDGPHNDTVDGREYMDLKWGVVVPQKNSHSSRRGVPMPFYGEDGHMLVDEQYEHAPAAEGEGEGGPIPPSLARQRFSDIVTRLQQNVTELEGSLVNQAVVPMMRLSKYFLPAKLQDYHLQNPDDEKKEEEQLILMNEYLEGATNETSKKRLETVFAQMGAGSPTVQERVKEISQSSYVTEDFVKGIIDTMDSDVVDELESLNPGISERLLLRYIEETNFDPSKDSVDAVCQHLDIFARRYLVESRYFEGQRYKDLASSKSPHASERTGSSGLVKRFVDQIEESAEVEELISADGRLHKPTFARLITRYLGEMIGEPSPYLGGKKAIRRGSGRVADRYLGRKEDGDDCKDEEPIGNGRTTTEIVNRFIASMQDAAEREPVVDAHGNLDRDVFEKMVSRYLAEASCLEEEEALHAVDAHAMREEGSRKAADDARDVVGELHTDPVEKLRSAPRRISAGFAKRFITQMEQAAEVEPLVTADGKLNKSTFEKLTTRYLVEPGSQNDNDFLSQARSPLALAQARRNAGKVGRRGHVAQPEPENEEEFSGPQSPEFVGRFIQHMEDAVNRESIITAGGKLDKPAFEKLVNRYLTEAAGEAVSSSGKSRARLESNDDYTTFPPFGHSYSTGFVKRFAAHMEQISRGEQFESVDKPLLEELVLRCLVEFEKDGLLEGASDMLSVGDVSKSRSTQSPLPKAPSFDDDVSRLVSSGFVEGLVEHLDHFSKENHLVDSDGKLDIPGFERQLTLYLTDIPSPSARHGVESAAGISRVSRQNAQRLLAHSRSSAGDGTPETEVVAFASPGLVSPSESDFFRQMREVDAGKAEGATKETDKTLSRDNITVSASVESLDSDRDGKAGREDIASDAGSRAGGASQNVTKGTARRLDMAHKFAGSVSNKVGGFVQMMYGKTRSKEEEMEAVAAFRQTQGDRDDSSSMSSFRVSDGMKQVVKNFRASKLSPRNEEEESRLDRSEADDESIGTLERQQSHEGYEDQASTNLYPQKSFSQAGSATPSAADFSPERARIFHQMVMDKSALIGGGHAERSIIDTDGSEASRTAMDPNIIKHLLLSPTLLTKRHQQAIRAVENRSWEQVSYLLSANPWLAEMTDLTTTQYLLHKVALYGAGEATVDKYTGELIAVRNPPAPEQLNTDLVRMFPASVHKFDQDGNLPLHMATASANFAMIKLLGDRFPSGASVRNEDGMLPLHLIILACASPNIAALGIEHSPTDIIKTVLDYFPGAVAVTDNEGNLPIHTAAVAWRGHAGVDVLYLLLDEARRQIQNPYGVRFRNKTTVEDMENESMQTETTVSPTDSANEFDDVVHCTMVRNDFGETALLAAIHARVGWEMVEALARGLGGTRAALCQDSEKNNALHLLVGDRFKDPAAALSILKVAREAATVCNEEGMLPIEIACMQMLPREVILALVLVDLPIDLDQKGVGIRDGFGGSWWYLSCECDDHYADVVEEVVSICSYPQVREICFMKDGSEETLISHATPKCRNVLQRALRFVGRFEFLSNSNVQSDESRGLRVFEALDFGTRLDPIPEGRRVLLKCFTREEVYMQETAVLRENEVDFALVEEVLIFAVGEDGSEPVDGEPTQYYVAIERPNLTLEGVVTGMLENEECQTDSAVRQRYSGKVFSVLRVVAKALQHLHSRGIVHGNVCMENCGKYNDKWKLSDSLGMQRMDGRFEISRFDQSAPPECIEPASNTAMEHEASFRHGMVTEASIDSWAFGKLAYEVLTGEELVEFENDKNVNQNHQALMDIMHWSNFDQEKVLLQLKRVGISNVGIDLIVQCLAPRPEGRPNMDQILKHPVWKELKRQIVSSGGQERRRGRPHNDNENA